MLAGYQPQKPSDMQVEATLDHPAPVGLPDDSSYVDMGNLWQHQQETHPEEPNPTCKITGK